MKTPRSNPQALYEVIRLVRPLYKALEGAVALELESSGATVPQRAVLELLHDHGDQAVPEIGRRMIAPRQYIQKIANELLAADLIEKRRNAAHKRSDLLTLTETGATTIKAIKAREAAVMRPIARSLAGRDVDTTHAVMADMIAAFRTHVERRKDTQAKDNQEGDPT